MAPDSAVAPQPVTVPFNPAKVFAEKKVIPRGTSTDTSFSLSFSNLVETCMICNFDKKKGGGGGFFCVKLDLKSLKSSFYFRYEWIDCFVRKRKK